MKIFIPVVLQDNKGNQMRAKMEVEWDRMETIGDNNLTGINTDAGTIIFTPEGCFDPWNTEDDEDS